MWDTLIILIIISTLLKLFLRTNFCVNLYLIQYARGIIILKLYELSESVQDNQISPNRRSDYYADQAQTGYDQQMRWRHFKNVFQEESIQFRYLPKNNKLSQCKKSHVCTCWIQPSHRSPLYWCKLENCSFYLSGCGRYIPENNNLGDI